MRQRVLLPSLLALMLAGCGGGSLLDFGSDKNAVLSGTREPVLPESDAETLVKPSGAPSIPAPVAIGNWSQPGGNPSHVLGHLAFTGAPKKIFAVSVGEGSDSDGRLTAPPIVVNGVIYTIDSLAEASAFDAASGKRLWSVSLVPEKQDPEGGYGGGLASDGARLYAVTAFGEAIALNPADGKQIWRQKLDAPVRTAPTVADSKLVFTSVTNDIYALNTADGSVLWRTPGSGEQASAISSASPAITGGIVVAPTTSGDLTAVSVADGMQLWSESLTALDTSTGLANLNDIAARPVMDGANVYALSHTGRFAAFKAKSGEKLWERELSGTETPWLAGDALFVISSNNTLHAVSAKTGGDWWTVKLPPGNWAGPVLAGGKLWAVSSTGQAAGFDPLTGAASGALDIGGKFFIAPVIANGTAYILSDDADLIAFR